MNEFDSSLLHEKLSSRLHCTIHDENTRKPRLMALGLTEPCLSCSHFLPLVPRKADISSIPCLSRHS